MHALFEFALSKLMKIYVDDTLLSNPKENIANTLNIFNFFLSKIKFTLEIEKHWNISFLKILLIRDEHKFKSNQYIKPINKGICSDLHSNHSISQQKMIQTDGEFRQTSRKKVGEIFEKEQIS